MRKILSLLGAMVLSTTASTSIIACGGTETPSIKKNNLNKFKQKNTSISVQINELYSELNFHIVNLYFGFTLKDGYEIKYYSDEQGTTEITNNKQKAGNVYFTIKADDDDPFWEGTTKILNIYLFGLYLEYNINQNDFPTDFKKQSNNVNKYTELNSYIISSCTKFNNFSLKDGYEIKYYSDEQGTTEITNNKQNAGDVYFTIKADDDDINWYGKTKNLKLKLT